MKSIIVREFDIINEKLLIDKLPEYNGEFNELVDFVEQYSCNEDSNDPYNFLSIKKNREYGTYVSFKNYVGLIQLKSGFQIEILPKIDMTDSILETKRVFLKMLKSIKDFDGKVFSFSNLNIDSMTIYDLFINIYLQDVSQLVKRGLKSSYISVEDNLPYAKGKVIVKEQIRKNLLHKERIYESFDEYQLNRPENKLIKSTLEKLLKISTNDSNKRLCRQILTHFSNIDVSNNYDYDFSKVNVDRSMQQYDLILKWSKVFLKNKSFTTFSGDNNSRALLFPMEKLFESYIAKLVKNIFADDYIVNVQDTGYYLFDNPTHKFALRPDLVVTKKDDTVIIMDTKWKKLFDNKYKNYGISQADMYQMYAYAKKYNTSKIWVLYPNNLEMNNHDLIQFRSDDNVEVNIFFVDLLYPEKSILELMKKL